MKLFEFVRRSRRPSAAPAPVAAVPAEKKKRRRPSSSSSGSAAWKPTLGAISEDAAVAEAEKAKAKLAAAAMAKAQARERPPPRASRPDYDDFRRFGAPTVLPAFGPAAFLF